MIHQLKNLLSLKYSIILICGLLIVLAIILYSHHLLLGGLLFHTDIARDFLLIEDMVLTKKPTFIGPRVGGIPGMFFSPIWLYLNLPAFLLGDGNPVIVGYFWLLLMIAALVTTFWVAKKIFGVQAAFLSTALFAFTLVPLAPGFTQSFGQIIFSPLLLYLAYHFLQKTSYRYLLLLALVGGIIFQFQPAYGMISLFLSFLLSLIVLYKKKKLRYLSAWFILVLPFLTYLIFELRHNFLEFRAFYTFIFHHPHTVDHPSYLMLLQNRVEGFFATFNISGNSALWLTALFVLLNGAILYQAYTDKKWKERTFVFLFYIYYVSFWLVTLLFNGIVWNYYLWGFLPLFCLMIGSLYRGKYQSVFLIFFSILLIFMANAGIQAVASRKENFSGKNGSSWKLNKQVAEYIYQDADQHFGYFIYSPDEFGYSIKYALHYVGRTEFPAKQGESCRKENEVYLVYYPTASDSKTDPVYWKRVRVNLQRRPVEEKQFFDLRVEKYVLTNTEQQKLSDPNLICDSLNFR